MSFYNSKQRKVFAQRFTLVKTYNDNTHNKVFSRVHPINQDNRSVFYDRQQSKQFQKRFKLVK